jgi:hypothetical protein
MIAQQAMLRKMIDREWGPLAYIRDEPDWKHSRDTYCPDLSQSPIQYF